MDARTLPPVPDQAGVDILAEPRSAERCVYDQDHPYTRRVGHPGAHEFCVYDAHMSCGSKGDFASPVIYGRITIIRRLTSPSGADGTAALSSTSPLPSLPYSSCSSAFRSQSISPELNARSSSPPVLPRASLSYIRAFRSKAARLASSVGAGALAQELELDEAVSRAAREERPTF